jgi:metallophosphoesterase (TIGR03767 family)
MGEIVRTDMGGSAGSGPGQTLVSVVHISDMHVLDAASPARGEWVELEAHDPLFRPLLHMHRPYDAVALAALHAHVESIRADDRGCDLVVSTGDNIDNGQRNEFDAYLAIVAGGTAQLTAAGSAQDASTHAFDEPWPYWCPDPTVADVWRDRGYPVIDDFVAQASAPIVSAGLGVPWTSVPGNHDLMRQGTALDNASLAAIAVGGAKSLRRPAGFSPGDPPSLFLDEPEAFSSGPTFAITADPKRRVIDRAEWIDAHRGAGALGFEPGSRDDSIDRVIDTEHVRFVLLDTNHPAGDYQGSVGVEQLEWLDARLAEVDAEQSPRVVVLVSHHGTDSLVNERQPNDDRRLAGAINAVVHRHPCVIAWLLGHRHVNRIEPRPGDSGGYWEVTTCSTIDWPSETRRITIARQPDGAIEIACTMQRHRSEPDSLAGLHPALAERFAGPRAAERMAGRGEDRDVRLVLPPR